MIPDQYGNASKRPGTEFVTIGGAGCYWTTVPSNPAAIHIYTAAQLQLVGSGGAYPNDGDYELMNDIDLSTIDNFIPRNLTTGGSLDGGILLFQI